MVPKIGHTYCVLFRAPCFKEDTDMPEWVQNRATNVRGLETKSFEEKRLVHLA